MNEIEDVFVEESHLHVDRFDVAGGKVKIGEIFQLKDGSQAMNCIRCFQEFQYFSEFSLHIEEHYLNGDIPRPYEIKSEEEENVDAKDTTVADVAEYTVKVEPTTLNADNENEPDDNENNFDNGDFDDANWFHWSDNQGVASEKLPVPSVNEVFCPLCSKPFANVAYVRKHINRFHKLKYSAEQIKEAQKLFGVTSFDQTEQNGNVETKVDPELVTPTISDQKITEAMPRPVFSKEKPESQSEEEELIAGKHYKKVDKMFKCLTCARKIRKFYDFKEHHKIHTGTKNIICPICARAFLTIPYVRKHISASHKQKYTNAMIKGYQQNMGNDFVDVANLCQVELNQSLMSTYAHNKPKQETKAVGSNESKKEQKRILECFICHRQMTHIKSLKGHMKTHDGIKFSCHLCDRTFARKRYVADHLVFKHRITRSEIDNSLVSRGRTRKISEYECFLCKNRYQMEKQLKRHMQSHMGHQFVCHVCGAVFRGGDTLKHHIEVHNADANETHKCSSCEKTFPTHYYKVKHERRVHQGTVKTFLCTICAKILRSNESFRHHMQLHSADPSAPHKCSQCEKTFTTRRYMLAHKRKSHETRTKPKLEYTVQCTECRKMFLNQNNLEQHMKTHAKEPATCTVCGWQFAERSNLKQHMETHFDNTTTCTVCNKVLTMRYLQKHMKIHEGIKNWQCSECDSVFINKQRLKKHMIRHTRELKHKCSKCPSAYARSEKLLYHLRQSHPELLTFTCRTCNKGFLSVRSLKKHENDHYKFERGIGPIVYEKKLKP